MAKGKVHCTPIFNVFWICLWILIIETLLLAYKHSIYTLTLFTKFGEPYTGTGRITVTEGQDHGHACQCCDKQKQHQHTVMGTRGCHLRCSLRHASADIMFIITSLTSGQNSDLARGFEHYYKLSPTYPTYWHIPGMSHPCRQACDYRPYNTS